MKKVTIGVTEAARNFADCVNQVNKQKVTFVLLKKGSPVARLAPNNEKICTGRDLAGVLSAIQLSDEDAKTWRHNLQTARLISKSAT